MNRDSIFCGITRTFLLMLLVVLAGCATSSTRIVSSNDPATDFSQYRFYSFADPLSVDRNGVRTSLGVELVAATTRVLQKRGLRLVSSNPDLRIDFFLAQSNTGSANTFVHAHSGMSTWSGYDTRSSTARHMAGQIINGTLIIDMVDTRRGTLVFEGLAESRITESMRDNLAETVNAAVADILSEMP